MCLRSENGAFPIMEKMLIAIASTITCFRESQRKLRKDTQTFSFLKAEVLTHMKTHPSWHSHSKTGKGNTSISLYLVGLDQKVNINMSSRPKGEVIHLKQVWETITLKTERLMRSLYCPIQLNFMPQPRWFIFVPLSITFRQDVQSHQTM